MNLSTIPVKNPRNAPEACLNAAFICEPEINPATNAPTKGPKIIPNGPNQKPRNRPKPAPQTTILLPPIFLVLHIGNKLSSMNTIIVNNPTNIITDQERCSFREATNFNTNKPNQDSGGPGNTGNTEPTTPTISKIMAKVINKGSNIDVYALYKRRKDKLIVAFTYIKNHFRILMVFINDVFSKLCEVPHHDPQSRTDTNHMLYPTNPVKFQYRNGSELFRLHTTHFALSKE